MRTPLTYYGGLNLSVPCARLIVAGVVTGVADTTDGVNAAAVADVERYARHAVAFATEQHGRGWWNERAADLLEPEPEPATASPPTRRQLIADALEQLEQARPLLSQQGYLSRREALLEALREPAADADGMIRYALAGLPS